MNSKENTMISNKSDSSLTLHFRMTELLLRSFKVRYCIYIL